jgi:NAD(P)-dependent dehydrogenase (short-subunit alcohol dehydrogenase family)
MIGMSHYGAGKRALEYWTVSVAAEQAADGGATLFAVVPFAVDTPMVRDVMQQPASVQPVASDLRAAADAGALASASDTADEIWRLVLDGDHAGEIIPVGAVPPELRR